MNTELMFSSKTDLWSTPQDFFNKWDSIFHFDLDVCASRGNRKCEKFYSNAEDGLKQEWHGICWMNPPYGRGINKWIQKAYYSAKKDGTIVVCLVPSRTDTKWWHDYCMNGEIYFIKGRLKFGGNKNSAPFPSAIVIFGRDKNKEGQKYKQRKYI